MSLDLWVRAGSDDVRLGGDPVAQQIFMILILKSEDPDSRLKFNVKTVHPAKAPPEFRQAALRQVPALQLDEDTGLQHTDDIIEYIDKTYPHPSLKYTDQSAEEATLDLFSKFCFFIKEVNKDPKGLEAELIKLDKHLAENETDFLTGDKPTHLDCRILPKLHAIRIACKELKQFDIPMELKDLWRYMKRGYDMEAFRRSCPCDQEVVLYWADRPDTPNISGQKRTQLYRQKPEHTMDVPVE